MRICEATNMRIEQLRREKRMTGYALIYQSGMPPSTVKSILQGKSQNPGIVNIKNLESGEQRSFAFGDVEAMTEFVRTSL